MMCVLATSAYADREKVFTVGVRAYNGVQLSYQRWTPTLKYLDSRQNRYSFNLMPVFGFEQMRKLVENKEIDFVITQPAEAVQLKEKYNTNIFLTLINQYEGKALPYFSAVVFTKTENSSITDLKDMKGKTLAAIDPEGFGAYWMGLSEIRDVGLREYSDFNVVFTGTQDRVVDYVLDGKADAGTVRSGILERMAKNGRLNLKDIKVLHAVHDELPQMHSTKLYPEWAFSAREGIDQEIVAEIQKILISIPPDDKVLAESRYAGWVKPVSYTSVYELMKKLKVGLYAHKPFIDFRSLPFYFKVLLPLAVVWLLILGYVIYSIYRK
ncbi:MAG: phosphate/phosphite/phosphonate ABC transporter substrate-binding protein [Deferribacterales bacterium]